MTGKHQASESGGVAYARLVLYAGILLLLVLAVVMWLVTR